MGAAIVVDQDPLDLCSVDISAPVRLSKPVTIGGLGADIVITRDDTRPLEVTVGEDADGVWIDHGDPSRARERLAPHALFEVDGVTFGVEEEIGGPFEHVHAVDDWLLIDAVRADRPARYHAFSRTSRRQLAAIRRVTFDPDGARGPLRRAPDRWTSASRARGVNLTALLGRAGADLDPVLGAQLAKRLVYFDGYLVDVDVGWDGSIVRRPAIHRSGTGSDAARLAHLLRATLPLAAQRALTDMGLRVGEILGHVVADAAEAYVHELTQAVEALEVRTLSADEVANTARGLFPDEWRAELELQEQLAMLDDRVIADLLARARPLAP